MQRRNHAAILALGSALVWGCATRHATGSDEPSKPISLTQESAASFVKECVHAVSKRDASIWDLLVDFAIVPKGALPILLRDGKDPSVDLWMTSFPELQKWLETNQSESVSERLEVVAATETQELRDLRAISVEDLRTGSAPKGELPKISVQTLTLGLDFDGDGQIASEEKTRVHLHDGTLYWEPFGW